MGFTPIPPVALQSLQELATPLAPLPNSSATRLEFSQMLSDGIESVNTKMIQADQLVEAFALDDSIPVHQVTFALEQARLSFELMLQVRNRLVESYQQLMNMQI